MTDSAAAYATPAGMRRPGAPSRPADPRTRLHVVPDATLQSETATNSATGEDTPLRKVSAAQRISDGAKAGAARLQIADLRGLWTRTSGYWTPPAIFTTPPASLEDLADYARHAPWTQQNTGIFRTAGISYYRLIAYPATVGHRYAEWVWQRPLRLAAHLAGIKLLAQTAPGIWVVDHLIYPAAQLAGHLFL